MARLDIDLFRFDVHLLFHGLRKYVQTLEDQIEKIEEAERKDIQKASYEFFGEREIELQNHDWLFEEVLPRNFRFSCLVLLYASLEITMNKLCNELQERNALELQVRELKEGGVKRALLYIRKVAGIQLPVLTFEKKIQDLGTIRNCIVHTGGYIQASSNVKEVSRVLKNNLGFSVSDDGYINILKGTCATVVNEICEWFDPVLNTCGFGSKPIIGTERFI